MRDHPRLNILTDASDDSDVFFPRYVRRDLLQMLSVDVLSDLGEDSVIGVRLSALTAVSEVNELSMSPLDMSRFLRIKLIDNA